MIFEIMRGGGGGGGNWLGGERMGLPIFSPGKKTDWGEIPACSPGKEWAGPLFPRGKNWLGKKLTVTPV